MRTWEITQIYYNLPCNKCWCEWVPKCWNKVYCYWTMKCWNVFSLSLSLFCLVREFSDLWQDSHKSCFMLNNNSLILNIMPQVCPATVAVPETILVTLSPYGAVPALGTSLLVVSAHLHALGGGVSEAGIGNPNLRKLPLFAHSHKSTTGGSTLVFRAVGWQARGICATRRTSSSLREFARSGKRR